MMRQRLIFTILVVLSAITSLFWLSHKNPEAPSRDVTKEKQAALIFARNVDQTTFNTKGAIKRITNASSLEQFAENKPSVLYTPNILVLKDQTPAWTITSNSALVENEDLITFIGEVEVDKFHEDDESSPGWNLQTEKLIYEVSKEYASTDQAVRMENRNGILNAIGMKMDMKQEKVTFDRDLNAIYQPAP